MRVPPQNMIKYYQMYNVGQELDNKRAKRLHVWPTTIG